MLRLHACVVGACFSVVGSALPAAGQTYVMTTTTMTVEPIADTFVCGAPARAGQNFGGAGALSFAPAGSSRGELQSLLRFDLGATVHALEFVYGNPDWSFVEVRLEAWSVAPLNAIFNPPAAGSWAVDWIANDAWVEGTGTPNAPTTDGVTFNTLGSFLSPDDQPLGTFAFGGGSGALSVALTVATELAQDVRSGGLVSLRVRSAGGSGVLNSLDFVSSPGQQPRLVLVVRGRCRADLVCGAIPGAPCNPVLNNDDFFYFLSNFAAGNLAVVDMTASAVPGTPGYGFPNGIINNDDFFFYLSLFAAGC